MPIAKIVNLKSASVLTLAVISAASQANLLNDGSFESVTPSSFGFYDQVGGWTHVGAPKIEVGKASVYGVTGQDGNNVLELDSTQNSTVSQSINLTAGTYAMSFAEAKRANTTSETNEFSVFWDGKLLASFSPTSTAFSTHSYNLTGVTGMNTLTFVGTGTNDSYGGMIDNVQLNAQPAPEPAPIVLCVGAIGAFILRRRS